MTLIHLGALFPYFERNFFADMFFNGWGWGGGGAPTTFESQGVFAENSVVP